MTTAAIQRFAAPQPLVSGPLRIAAALAVVVVVMLATFSAQAESVGAVRSASAAFTRSSLHVTLPPVQVVGRREAAHPGKT